MKDYAKKTFKPSNTPKSNTAARRKPLDKKRFWRIWGGSLLLVIAALIVAQLFYRHHEATQKSEPTKVVTKKVVTAKPIAIKPKFDFYEVLPKQTVQTTPAKQITTATAPVQPKKHKYMLQVASYRSQSQAKAMQARLLLLGLTPVVKSTSSGWYRVDLGPFSSKRLADVAKHKVQKASISGSMIRAIPAS